MPRIMRTTVSDDALAGAAAVNSGAIQAPSYIDRVVAGAFADEAGTLFIDQSPNGTDWFTPASTTVDASEYTQVDVILVYPYFRVRYVNGADANTVFNLAYVMLGPD